MATAVASVSAALPPSQSTNSTSTTPLPTSDWQSRDLTDEFLAELKKSFTKNLVKTADMSSELQSEAIDLIVSAIDKQRGNYEGSARAVKEQMDRKFGSSWHCVIGEGFGFEVTYEMKHCMLLYYQGNLAVLLFKC